MGNTIWVQVRGDDGPTGGEQDNSVMLAIQDQLDAIAERVGVPKLSTFFDYTCLAEQFADEMEDAGEAPPPEVWSAPNAGVECIRALIREVNARPDAMRFSPEQLQSKWPESLRDELEHCAARLEQAMKDGQAFRFLIVP